MIEAGPAADRYAGVIDQGNFPAVAEADVLDRVDEPREVVLGDRIAGDPDPAPDGRGNNQSPVRPRRIHMDEMVRRAGDGAIPSLRIGHAMFRRRAGGQQQAADVMDGKPYQGLFVQPRHHRKPVRELRMELRQAGPGIARPRPFVGKPAKTRHAPFIGAVFIDLPPLQRDLGGQHVGRDAAQPVRRVGEPGFRLAHDAAGDLAIGLAQGSLDRVQPREIHHRAADENGAQRARHEPECQPPPDAGNGFRPRPAGHARIPALTAVSGMRLIVAAPPSSRSGGPGRLVSCLPPAYVIDAHGAVILSHEECQRLDLWQSARLPVAE
jgi:hypothetical protein